MIRNFDKETCPLNSYELDVLLSRITTVLKDRFGKDKAITNEMIRNTHLTDYLANEARVLKVINHIRTIGIVKGLMATSRGYYIAQSREELETYIDSLQGREGAINHLRQSIRKQMNATFPLSKKKQKNPHKKQNDFRSLGRKFRSIFTTPLLLMRKSPERLKTNGRTKNNS